MNINKIVKCTKHKTNYCAKNNKIKTQYDEFTKNMRYDSQIKFMTFIKKQNNNKKKYLIGGCVLGTIATMGGVYVSTNNSGGIVEKMLAKKYEFQFNKQTCFEERLKIYHSIPELNIPVYLDGDCVFLISEQNDLDKHISKWLESLTDMIKIYNSNHVMKLKQTFKNLLLKEALSKKNIYEIIKHVQLIMGSCLERDLLLSKILNEELEKNDWIDIVVLKKLCDSEQLNSPNEQPFNELSKIILAAISFYPGNTLEFVNCLKNPKINLFELNDFQKISSVHKKQHENQIFQINNLRLYFQSQDEKYQNIILHQALTNIIRTIPNSSNKIFKAYEKIIDENLIEPLKNDARISIDVLQQVKQVFLALPPKIQSRVLLVGFNNKNSICKTGETEKLKTAELVKKLLSAGGVVAIKLAQILSESENVPKDYKKLLGCLRDSNEPMSIMEFWNQLPIAIQNKTSKLGKCLGTGSIKQVQIAKGYFEKEKEIKIAIGTLRKNIQNEALSSFEALKHYDGLSQISDRLESLVYGEFDLFKEGKNIKNMSNTPIGKNKYISPVKIIHNSPSCLVETLAVGPTIATLSKKYEPEKLLQDQLPDIIKMIGLLEHFHESIFNTFIEGHIHSDIHLGNIIYNETPDKSKLIIFDVGQFQKITKSEILAVSWIIASLTNLKNFKRFSKIAIDHVILNSHINYDCLGEKDLILIKNVGEKKWLKTQLEKILIFAIKHDRCGKFPKKTVSYLSFLKKSEEMGVMIPQSAFAAGKMMDCVISQQKIFSLEPVFEKRMEEYLTKNMRWSELIKIICQTYIY